MGVDAYVLRYELTGRDFMSQFLASPDFDIDTLRGICATLGVGVHGRKTDLVHSITGCNAASPRLAEAVLGGLLARNRTWVSVKMGTVGGNPALADASDLVFGPGSSQWYGPLESALDPQAKWYIRPVFAPHWETSSEREDTTPQKVTIRWLCFARLSTGVMSLHWRGFTIKDNVGGNGKYKVQFPYWDHVPKLFGDMEDLTRSAVANVNLYHVILDTVWDKYRSSGQYEWVDKRIRAQAAGISLSARAGAVEEASVSGIRRLAQTLRRAVEQHASSRHSALPQPEEVDEVLLRTLIKEFGTVSYEFQLMPRGGSPLFWAHAYFGAKPGSHSPDQFPHLSFRSSAGGDLDQLRFLLDHT